jgi:excinuclease ABC subunit C
MLTTFKSVKNIKEADIEAIAQIIGPSKAKIVYEFFHPGQDVNLGSNDQ